MIKIENDQILKSFMETDKTRFAYNCRYILNDISFCGLTAEYYTLNGLNPAENYILFESDGDYLCMVIETENEELIHEASKRLYNLMKEKKLPYSNLIMFRDLTHLKSLNENFIITANNDNCLNNSGIYASYSADEISDIKLTKDIVIKEYNEEYLSLIQSVDIEVWLNLPLIIKFYSEDKKLYLIFQNNNFIGYLYSYCLFENYWDITMIFIHPSVRKKGYASMLVSYFAKQCYKNGLIPHYGNAATAESAALAEKVGFKKVKPGVLKYKAEVKK